MLARSSLLRTPSGARLETPALIPSFSSKGFRIGDDDSDLADVLEVTAPLINDSFLISAYDICHDLLPNLGHLRTHPPEGLYASPEVLFVDSGGFEVAPAHDLSETYEFAYEPLDWDEELHAETLDSLPSELPAVVISFDRKAPTIDQIQHAADLFDGYPSFLHALLLKPETEASHFLSADAILKHAGELAGFDIIGLTEKELGNDLTTRLKTLATVRVGLDTAGVDAPLHVFGSLDPLLSLLYFLAGVEIFDGLTWLRYAYHDGLAIYGESLAALNEQWHFRRAQRRAQMLVNNLDYLQRMKNQMRRFLVDEDFSHFENHQVLLEKAYVTLQTMKGE